jgi:hypothetical protein
MVITYNNKSIEPGQFGKRLIALAKLVIRRQSEKIPSYMSSKYQIGDYIKLVDLVVPNLHNNEKKALITHVQLVQHFYYSLYHYTVIVDDNMEVIDGVTEACMKEWENVSVAVADVWPPPCNCDTWQLATTGCDCGAMAKEREMIEKGYPFNPCIRDGIYGR